MNEEHQRPDPDQLLSLIQKEESRKDHRRGHLKIFLGYVAGVGKTYRMLSEAHVLHKQGKDVVVGIAETHGRSETRELLKGLEVIPRQKIDYRGIILDEMDIDQVLERKPDYVLVDELAHNNVPGSRHLKRYQDVDELLSAGINVYSTLNIQHIESINDIVRQITGVEVRETVPDKIVELADKIELVDLPIDELLERLKEGKVYIPDKAKQAMENFFTEKNLVALREMALRYATVHVDYDMDYYLKKENILGPWETSNRIMVCISPNVSSKRLIRIAHRFADRFNAEWFAVYVEPSYKFRLRQGEIQQLENNLKLADELDGKVFRLTGSISDEIVSFAQSKNITLILMGHSRRTRLQELIEGSIINKVIQKSDAQVLVVENEGRSKDSNLEEKDSDTKFDWKPYTVSFISIGATLIICLMLQPFIEAINIPMIFIIPVALTGMLAGRKAGILASLLAVAVFDFFFVPPFYTFTVDDVRFIPTFLVLFVVGIITSLLADTVKKQVEYTRQREAFISSLYDFSKDLLISQDLNDILDRSTTYISESFNYDVLILLPDEENNLKIVSRFGNDKNYDDHEMGVSNWVYEHKKSAGCGTDTLSSSKWYHIPLKVQKGNLGVMAIAPNVNMDNREKHLIDAFASVVALALSNSINKHG
ncbi:MAG: osmosensitive K+ channel histidine kinase [Methanobacterium sp. Maddingley MBC34]|nr:MAG: osmosensitive K+ channel histidine kinase [Methanobacterium sp. Maddingley MBC34]